ncbi:adenosylcobinamide-GDP ribazoletransferase [Candidatus Contubernalis alkaliaceticus]|uniref:adenosylcobinamide-GDP ribazoletransferase n=1 Tax=Candidatus Contubernalis alkaliaceticus TaxID=338645 RepID=UPI001F4C2B72|nr:adenosylcobinamide-GDP ribazoletransferase [Candidatus Contubernalis alkalaceticus]UNC92489.1 adenosylcobinamide-GDP ribazoletransferase [Candidatus Contubernalis alkalaceticus]
MKAFLIAMQFLTRIPVTVKGSIEEDELLKSIYFYPLIGLIIGIILFFINQLVSGVMPSGVIPTVILASLVFLTGGLHMDGFMDTMDALGSGAEKERALEIMKDSRVGAFGVLGAIILLIVKLSFLQNLSIHVFPDVLLVMPILSRLAVVVSMPMGDYAREGYGLGKVMIDGVGWKQVLVTTAFSLLLVFPVIGFRVFSISAVLILFLFLWNGYLKRKIGGITGDTLGATIEMADVLVLTVMLLF